MTTAEVVLGSARGERRGRELLEQLLELGDLRASITVKNYREYYHDALEHREELFTLFNLGLVSLEDRAKGEVLFWDVCERADKYAQQAKYVSEEFDDLRRLLCAKYLTNFSVFRSVPDHWALDQLFPIVPIHYLNKPPTEYATLCDITCDSDGVVDKFVDLHDVKQVLELHALVPGETYYLAFLLVGAYQEVMGNNHNLFGTPQRVALGMGEESVAALREVGAKIEISSWASTHDSVSRLHAA